MRGHVSTAAWAYKSTPHVNMSQHVIIGTRPSPLLFTSRFTRFACSRLVLRLLYVFRYLLVCLFVSASPLITCAILRHALLCKCSLVCTVLTAFGGLQAKIQQPSIDLSCLDGEKVAGSHDNPIFSTYSW